jgi:ABC-type Fe3+/spermidine/putrescine transport system ATPase subunit
MPELEVDTSLRNGPSASRAVPDAELRSVVKVFGDATVAVDHISFAVERGEFFSILGPSGCGKSTTLRMIAGLEIPSGGEVLIRGEPMGRRPAHRRPTNTVFQRPALFPHLTVESNVRFGLKVDRVPQGELRARVAEALELVDLTGYEHRRPHELSGGQQQRVAIARALVKRPAVLLLDEPLSALDLRLREQMQEALKRIQAESSTTFVFVTHNQTEALSMSDRVAVMNAGRIEQIGTPAEIYNRPRTRFAATFIGDTNVFEGAFDPPGRLVCPDGFELLVPAAGSTAVVRPESLVLDVDVPAASGWNAYDAVVEELAFHGATVRCHLRTGTGRTLLAQLPSVAVRVARGDAVRVGWPVETAAVLPE